MKRPPKNSSRRAAKARKKRGKGGSSVEPSPAAESQRPAPQVLRHSAAHVAVPNPEPGLSEQSTNTQPASNADVTPKLVTGEGAVRRGVASLQPAVAAPPMPQPNPESLHLSKPDTRPIWPRAVGLAVLAVVPLALAAAPSAGDTSQAEALLAEQAREARVQAVDTATAAAGNAAEAAAARVEHHVRARTLGHTLASSAPRIALHVVENTMAAPVVWAEVEEGDDWQDIAARFGHSGTMLATLNPETDLNELTPGQRLLVHQWSPDLPSVSVGQPNRGRLLNGVPMPDGAHWRVRASNLAYGTDYAVSHLMRGLAYVGEQFPGGAVPMIGDLSRQRGGRLKRHRSHRSGRDADVAYYFHNHALSDNFTHATTTTMDIERQWALFEYWLERDLVIYIFIDPRLQRALRRYAVEQGVEQELLDLAFGSRNTGRSGVLRYSPGHRDHFHVRFRCDADDERCVER